MGAAVNCLTCNYDLRGLPEHRCPECGRTFDPAVPSTYRDPQRPTGFPLWVVAMVAAYPTFVLGLAVLTWCAAAISLGRPPRTTGADDPKSINAIVSLLHAATILGVFGIVAHPPECLVVLIACLHAGRTRRRGAATLLLTLLAVASFVVLVAALGTGLGEWLAD